MSMDARIRALATRTGQLLKGKLDIVDAGQLIRDSVGGVADFRIKPQNWEGDVGQRMTIPTHITPAGGQTTHPSALFFPEKWNGYRYWMAHTPYPAGNDDHEDPNLAVSNDGITWVNAPGVPQPLDDADGTPEYNSDVDLVMGPDDTMYLFWRWYDSSLGSNQERMYYRTSKDGSNWTAKQLVWQYTQTTLRPVSASFVFEDGKWTVWAVDITNISSARVIRMTSSGSAPTGWSTATTCTLTGMPAAKAPWHLEVRKIGGQYVMLLCAVDSGTSGSNGILVLGVSTNGTAWTFGNREVIPQTQSGEHEVVYRATMIPEFSDGVLGLRVWYSAWTVSPQVWNIYRTWIGPAKAVSSGGGSWVKIRPSSVGSTGVIQTNHDVVFTNTPAIPGLDIKGIFSSTYRQYKIVIDVESIGGSTSFFMRLLSGGTVQSGANYDTLRYYGTNAGPFAVGANGEIRWEIAPGTATVTNSPFSGEYTIIQPASSARHTRMRGEGSSVAGSMLTGIVSGRFNTTLAHDGINLYAGSSTMTGRVSIYGLV